MVPPLGPFWNYVSQYGECWNWQAAKTGKGYGVYKHQLAHRVVYEMEIGPIPENLVIDHLCHNTSCVRPSHLEPVSSVENIKRGYALRKSCPNGHPYPESAAVRKHKDRAPHRYCAVCNRERNRMHYLKRKASVFEGAN